MKLILILEFKTLQNCDVVGLRCWCCQQKGPNSQGRPPLGDRAGDQGASVMGQLSGRDRPCICLPEAGGHPPCPGPSWASLHFILGEQTDEMPHPVSSSGVQRKPEPRAERDGPGVFAEGELGSQRGAGPGAPLWAKGSLASKWRGTW